MKGRLLACGAHSPGLMLTQQVGGVLGSGGRGGGGEGHSFPVGMLDPNSSGVPRGGRDSLHTMGSIGTGDGSGLPAAGTLHRQSSTVTLGFSDAIVNALAQKKLDEAKRTKKELMAERMKGRIGRSASMRGEELMRAASKQLKFDDEDEDDDDEDLTPWQRFVKRARATFSHAVNVTAYAAFRAAKPIIESEDFELLIIVIIFVNCISLALFRPTEPPSSEWNSTLDTLELCLNGIFTLEFLLRCMYIGVREYFRDRWSQFDFLLVLAGYSGFLSTGGGEGENTGGGLRALRAMRALRPLRTITRFESLRSVVVCFIEAVPLLVSVVGVGRRPLHSPIWSIGPFIWSIGPFIWSIGPFTWSIGPFIFYSHHV